MELVLIVEKSKSSLTSLNFDRIEKKIKLQKELREERYQSI